MYLANNAAGYELGTAIPQLFLFILQYTIGERFFISREIGKSFLKFKSRLLCPKLKTVPERDIRERFPYKTNTFLHCQGNCYLLGKWFINRERLSQQGNCFPFREKFSKQMHLLQTVETVPWTWDWEPFPEWNIQKSKWM